MNSAEKAAPAAFLRSGVGDLLAIVETLGDAIARPAPDAGTALPARPTIMELGCGLGRLLRHAPAPALAEVVATDVNVDSLEWCRTHLPGVRYHHHGPAPPIDGLSAMSVDIVYAHSVFTHIPLERHLDWLRELERILRPGGWLVATFLGREQQDARLDADQLARLALDGAVQVDPEWAADAGGLLAYGAVCQTVAHQDATVGTVFDLGLRRTRPGRQDVLAARRR